MLRTVVTILLRDYFTDWQGHDAPEESETAAETTEVSNFGQLWQSEKGN